MTVIATIVKMTVAATLIYFTLRSVEIAEIGHRLDTVSALPLAVAAVLLLCQFIIFRALRWVLILAALHRSLSFRKAIAFVSIGQFFNQMLPSSIGGDGMLIYLVHTEGEPLRVAVHSVVIDRAIGTIALLALSTITLCLASTRVSDGVGLIAWACVTAVGVLLSLCLPAAVRLATAYSPTRIAGSIEEFTYSLDCVLRRRGSVIALIVLCCIGHVSMAVAAVLVTEAFSISVPLVSLLLILPSVFLLTIIPISFGGWGLREAGMVILASNAAISSTDAFTISVLYGLTELIVSSVGGIVWLLRRRRSQAASIAKTT